jgi:hypothetical protein
MRLSIYEKAETNVVVTCALRSFCFSLAQDQYIWVDTIHNLLEILDFGKEFNFLIFIHR